jgi:Zn-dependent protease
VAGTETVKEIRVFGTPLVTKGWTWLPLTQLITWLLMSWLAGKRHPDRTFGQCARVGALKMVVMLGSEWAHNLAHAAAAQSTGKRMDALKVNWGMPRVVYHQINNPNVTPNEHIRRALGGPIINTLLLGASLAGRALTQPGSDSREVVNTAAGMNAFVAGAGLLPLPFLDGGPLLKWSLVKRGYTPAQADEKVRAVNGFTGAAMGTASALMLRKRKLFAGGLVGMLAGLSLAVAAGLIKEAD